MEFFFFFKNPCNKKVTHGGMTLGVFYSWNISNKFKLQGLRFGLTDFVMKHYWQILFLASLLEKEKNGIRDACITAEIINCLLVY